jgi:hypothetical protein
MSEEKVAIIRNIKLIINVRFHLNWVVETVVDGGFDLFQKSVNDCADLLFLVGYFVVFLEEVDDELLDA